MSAAVLALLLLAAPASAREAPEERERAFAWILNGDHHEHHVGNVGHAVETLLELGVARRNLFVASEGDSPDARLPKKNFGPATRQNLTLQLNLLAARIGPEDLLVVYITGHGLPSETDVITDTRVALHRALVVQASWLLEQVETRLKSPNLLVVTDCCFGGGLVLTLHDGTEAGFAGVSPADAETVTYCQPFGPDFWSALEGLASDDVKAAARAALSGCPIYREEGECMHAPYGCPSYGDKKTITVPGVDRAPTRDRIQRPSARRSNFGKVAGAVRSTGRRGPRDPLERLCGLPSPHQLDCCFRSRPSHPPARRVPLRGAVTQPVAERGHHTAQGHGVDGAMAADRDPFAK